MNDFRTKCLDELKSRDNWSDSFLPILDQYVFTMMEAQKLQKEIASESVEVEHTNKASHTNKATSPKWRMFLELVKTGSALAKDLKLNPANAPAGKAKKKGEGFDLNRKMKVA